VASGVDLDVEMHHHLLIAGTGAQIVGHHGDNPDRTGAEAPPMSSPLPRRRRLERRTLKFLDRTIQAARVAATSNQG
jgi:hypothetical protein